MKADCTGCAGAVTADAEVCLTADGGCADVLDAQICADLSGIGAGFACRSHPAMFAVSANIAVADLGWRCSLPCPAWKCGAGL